MCLKISIGIECITVRSSAIVIDGIGIAKVVKASVLDQALLEETIGF